MEFWKLVDAIRGGDGLDPIVEDILSTEEGEETAESLSEPERNPVPSERGEGVAICPEPQANPFGTTVSTAADMAAFIERNGKDL